MANNTNSLNSLNPVIQYVTTGTGTLASTALQIPGDNTIPQNTEGAELLTLSITPTSSTNILEIEFQTMSYTAPDNLCTIALFQDSTANALVAAFINNINGSAKTGTLKHSMTAGTTSSTTFKIRFGGSNGNTVTINGAGTQYYGGVANTRFTIKEIQA